MKNGVLKSIRILLVILVVGVLSCAFFLFDNYLEMMEINNAIEVAKKEQDAIIKYADSLAAISAAMLADSAAEAEVDTTQ